MRIAVISNAYPPLARGGAGRIAEQLVELWRESGYEVRVWSKSNPWIGKNPLARLFGHLFVDTSVDRQLALEIREWQPQVMVTHNLTACSLATPCFLQQQDGIRWIHVLHDVQLFEPSGQLRSETRITRWQRFWSWWRQRSFGQPDLVVSPTQWLLAAHQRRGWFVQGQTAVIPNPAPAFEELPKPLPVSLQNALFVGRVSADKGVHTLAELASKNTWLQLTVIGSGPASAELRQHRNIHLLGECSPDRVREEMRQAAFLLVPSEIVENQPTVILEALAVGLPVIATDIGGIRETVGNAGLLVADQRSAWSQSILRLQDREQYQEMQREIAHWRERYLATTVLSAWRTVFTEMPSEY